jgi:hypothetical protein
MQVILKKGMGIKTGAGEAVRISLEDRVEAKGSDADRKFVKRVVRRLPYDLVDGTFPLAAERDGTGGELQVVIYPSHSSDEISEILLTRDEISKVSLKLGEGNIKCSFASDYFSFRIKPGYRVRVSRKNPNT